MTFMVTKSDHPQPQVQLNGTDAIVHFDETIVDTDGVLQYQYHSIAVPHGLFNADVVTVAKKFLKQHKLATLTVTTASGKTFDANETARNNMVSAIMASEVVAVTTTQWKLADNTPVEVGLVELKEALSMAIQAVGQIVME